MDCCLCTVGNSYRPPRNTVCMSCYESAKFIIDLCRKWEQVWLDSGEEQENSRQTQCPHGLQYAVKQMKHLQQMEENSSEKLEFLESLVEAFQNELHSDVELVTDDGLSIHAHRVVMVSPLVIITSSTLWFIRVLLPGTFIRDCLSLLSINTLAQKNTTLLL